MSTARIIVASHKAYEMPEDEIYLPLFVGAALKEEVPEGFTPDNTGDNISDKNPFYCELTGLYWAWKNLSSDYIGLAHYRRHFGRKGTKADPNKNVFTTQDFNKVISKNSDLALIVPKKRKYYIESLESHYSHTHSKEHLEITRKVIGDMCPEFLPSYDRVLKQTYGYMFNMAIFRKDLLDMYCNWLFDVLGGVEKSIDTTNLSAFDARLYGRISEILFNVWMDFCINKGIIDKRSIVEMRYYEAGGVNWPRKIKSFLAAKFAGKKYSSSF